MEKRLISIKGIKFSCQCGQHIKAPLEVAGTSIECPACHKPTAAPQLGPATTKLVCPRCLEKYLIPVEASEGDVECPSCLLSFVVPRIEPVPARKPLLFLAKHKKRLMLATVLGAIITTGVVLARLLQNISEAELPKSHQIRKGDIQVSVTKVHFGQVPCTGIMEKLQYTKAPFLLIELSVENLNATKKVDFTTWCGGEWEGLAALVDDLKNSRKPKPRPPGVTLVDNFGNPYKRVAVTPATEDGTAYPEQAALYPKKQQYSAIAFELPVDGAQWVRLQLPATNFAGSGKLQFKIPMSKAVVAWEALKKAESESEYFESGAAYEKSGRAYKTNANFQKLTTQMESLVARAGSLPFATRDYDTIHDGLLKQFNALEKQRERIISAQRAEVATGAKAAKAKLEAVERELVGSE